MASNVLLVELELTKSKNYKNFLTIGLLKLASYYESKNCNMELVRRKTKPTKFEFSSPFI